MNKLVYFPNATDCYDRFIGLHFSIQSKTMSKLFKRFHLNKASGALSNGFGDEYWFYMNVPYTVTLPKDMTEFKQWLLEFFTLYGTNAFVPCADDETYDYIMTRKRHRIQRTLTRHIDEIMNDIDGFVIETINTSFDISDWTGERVAYYDQTYSCSELDEETARNFFETFEFELDVARCWVQMNRCKI
jgi:hypothetical protein